MSGHCDSRRRRAAIAVAIDARSVSEHTSTRIGERVKAPARVSAHDAWSLVLIYARRSRGKVKPTDERAHRAVTILGGYERVDRRREEMRPLFLQLYQLLAQLEEIP